MMRVLALLLLLPAGVQAQSIPPGWTTTTCTGSVLPSGHLSVVDKLITDGLGNNVRLVRNNFDAAALINMAGARPIDFNCVRNSWWETALGGTARQAESLLATDGVMSAAAHQNMKVVFVHAGNEHDSCCPAMQQNGLQYCLRGAAPWNGPDGCGTADTITHTTFNANWIAMGTPYVGNPIVIGLDLHNEPLMSPPANSGSGNGGDVRAMCNDVGSAIQAVNAEALTICEGSINNMVTFAGFHVSGGQIIAPNGHLFKARGINIHNGTLSQVVSHSGGQPLLTNFPGTNMVRIAMENGYNTLGDAQFVNAVTWLTALGIVVEIGNYSAPTQCVSTSTTNPTLAQEVTWYTTMAKTYKNNPYVWFNTSNEPRDTRCGQPAGSVTAEQVAVYNSIRGAGNRSMIGLAAMLSASSLTPTSAYSSMTNVHWDAHHYNWRSGFSTNLSVEQAQLNNEISDTQSVHGADGIIPVIISEFGNATDGNKIDPGGTQAVQAVLNVSPTFSGFDAWLYYWPNINTHGADQLVEQATGLITSYGRQVSTALSHH